jgi:hypothetical protein
MRGILGSALLTGALALSTLSVGCMDWKPAGGLTRAHGHRCVEDMPCWNCRTMGNHRCGR